MAEKLAEHIRVTQNGLGETVDVEIDGQPFPYRVTDGRMVTLERQALPTLTITIPAQRLEVVAGEATS